jgi:hypothetical protein
VKPRSPYLVSPAYDWSWFLLPPLLALVLGILIAGSSFADDLIVVNDQQTTMAAVCIGSLIHAHLVAVFFRSHANPSIFRLYPGRFVLVPPLLWIAIVSSSWVAVTATVVVTFWDVWHSGAQTFGFARIYDRNIGNPPELGRRLDFWLNQLLYAGPILAGATMLDHVDVFDNYTYVGNSFFASVPARASHASRWMTFIILGLGTVFVAFYVAYYAQLRRRGYRIPVLKVYLLATTGLCSIYTWGFNTWGEAFFIMNFFHAVQYLALVWAMERKTIRSRFRIGKLAPLAFFVPVAAYGILAELLDAGITSLWAATIVVSLMHFWYDGFVWSVRRKEI